MAVFIGGIGATKSKVGTKTKMSKLKKGDLFAKIGGKQVYVYFDRYWSHQLNRDSIRGFRFAKYGTDNFPLILSKKDIDVIRLC